MKHHSQLIEATLLKRPISFLMEVVLQSKKRIMLRCPNLGHMYGCDILGTQAWFSAPSKGHCLPTLELLEVNGGELVGINPENLKDLFIEALQHKKIHELSNYTCKSIKNVGFSDPSSSINLHNTNQEQCYVCLQHIIYCNEKLEGIFNLNDFTTNTHLDYLILRKKQGHRAILVFCVLHTGSKNLKVLESHNSTYTNKFKNALEHGVEILAYKAAISTQEITLANKLPIQLQAIAKL